jgi:prolipoprotein diacylglyceryltransferase
VILSLAFWIGVALLARSPERGVRSVVGLAISASLAHVGWCIQHAGAIEAGIWLEPARGATVLALPLGFLLAAPWRLGNARVLRFLGTCSIALLPCLAVARTACFVADCCLGRALEHPMTWGGVSITRHPVELYEIALWVICWWILRRVAIELVPGLFALGFGVARLLLCPLRAPATSAVYAHFSPEDFAAAWIAAGLIGICLRRHNGLRAMGAEASLAPRPAG